MLRTAFLSAQWPGTHHSNLLNLMVFKPQFSPGLCDEGGGWGARWGALSLTLLPRALPLLPTSRESQECHPPSSLPLPFTPSQPWGGGEETGWREQVSGGGEQARAPEGCGEEQSQGSEGRVTGQIGQMRRGLTDLTAQASHQPGLTRTKSLGRGGYVTGYRE